jgi:hypothetical protein
MDVYNVANSNPVFEVRSGTGETDVFIGGDTTDPSKRTRIRRSCRPPACSDRASSGSTSPTGSATVRDR